MDILSEYQNVIRFFVTCATSLLLVAVALGVRFPKGKEFRKMRIAKYLLCLSFVMIGVQIFFWDSIVGSNQSVVALMYLIDSVSYALLLVAPAVIVSDCGECRRLAGYCAAVGLYCILLQIFFVFAIHLWGLASSAVLWITGVLSVSMTAWLGVSFDRVRSSVGEEHVSSRRWVSLYNYVILAFFAYFQFLLPVSKPLLSLSLWATILFTLFNVWFVIKLYEYSYQVRLSDSVKGYTDRLTETAENLPVQDNEELSTPDTGTASDLENEERLSKSLEEWIRNRKYLEQDRGIEHVIDELGTDTRTFRQFFRTRMSVDFRTWRIAMRIEYAKEYLKKNPDISVNKLSEIAGFPTKSNFYHYFKQITGMTPAEYREYLDENTK